MIQDFLEFRNLLIKKILESGEYFYTQDLEFQFDFCPFCGESVSKTDTPLGIISTSFIATKKTNGNMILISKEVEVKGKKERTVSACHSACIGDLEIWEDAKKGEDKGYVIIPHSKRFVFAIEKLYFNVLFMETLKETGLYSHEWSNFKEYIVEDMPGKIIVNNLPVVTNYQTMTWEEDDPWYNKYKPVKKIPTKIKLYPELKCEKNRDQIEKNV